MDYEQFKQKVKDKVDDELVNQIGLGIIVGVPKKIVSREEARYIKPELSSDNPSRIWTRTQQFALSLEGTMEEALDMYEEALLPAALSALVDQQGQLLSSGKTCTWPSSPYAGSWVSWCVNNIAAIKKNIAEQVYNLNGYKLWDIGEISCGIFADAGTDPITGVQRKRIAVKTTYEGLDEVKHYYPNKNWH